MTQYYELIEGGESGPSIVMGNPMEERSLLDVYVYLWMTKKHMPP